MRGIRTGNLSGPCLSDHRPEVFLLFSTGKAVITGGTTIEEVRRGLGVFLEKFRTVGTLSGKNHRKIKKAAGSTGKATALPDFHAFGYFQNVFGEGGESRPPVEIRGR